jgi:hypothetical protein
MFFVFVFITICEKLGVYFTLFLVAIWRYVGKKCVFICLWNLKP